MNPTLFTPTINCLKCRRKIPTNLEYNIGIKDKDGNAVLWRMRPPMLAQAVGDKLMTRLTSFCEGCFVDFLTAWKNEEGRAPTAKERVEAKFRLWRRRFGF